MTDKTFYTAAIIILALSIFFMGVNLGTKWDVADTDSKPDTPDTITMPKDTGESK